MYGITNDDSMLYDYFEPAPLKPVVESSVVAPIITVEEYKAIENISDDSLDERLETLIPLIEEAYLKRRNSALENGKWPIGSKATAARMLNWLLYNKREEGQTNLNLGGGLTIQYDKMIDGYPAEIMNEIKHYVGVAR